MQVKEFSSTLSQRFHPVCYHLEGNRQGRLQGSQSTFLNLWFLLRVALPFNLYTKPCAVKVKMAGNILWWSRNNLHGVSTSPSHPTSGYIFNSTSQCILQRIESEDSNRCESQQIRIKHLFSHRQMNGQTNQWIGVQT